MVINRKRLVWGILCILLVWMGLNVIALGGSAYSAWSLKKSIQTAQFERMASEAKKLSSWLTGWKWISLQSYRLPYFRETYSLMWEMAALANNGAALVEEAQPMLGSSLGGVSIAKEEWDALAGQIPTISAQLQVITNLLGSSRFEIMAGWVGKTGGLHAAQKQVEDVLEMSVRAQQIVPILPELLGYEGEKHYIVLFQNNMELRPTGGFLGSYGEMWFENGAMKRFEVQDIYVPDGQIKGYVKEPDPIRDYLFRGDTPGWRLRDSNWNPDFPEAARVMDWFFTEGKLAPIDGIIAINLIPVLDVLKITGPIQLLDYDEEITADTFYQVAQTHAEIGFFPGSTQKGDFLSAVGRQLMRMMIDNEDFPREQLVPIVMRHLASKQIMVAFFNEPAADLINKIGWDGDLLPVKCEVEEPGCVADYLHLNEANLGINKTNCCLDRKVRDEVVLGNDEISHQLTITFTNHNPVTPDVPLFWGGGYHNYQRIFLPESAHVTQITSDGEPILMESVDFEAVEDKLSLGFLVGVGGGDVGVIEVSYVIPVVSFDEIVEYQQILQKQSGIDSIPWETHVFSEGKGNFKIEPPSNSTTAGEGEVSFDLARDVRLVVVRSD